MSEYWDKFGIGKEFLLCYTLSKVWGKENKFVSHYLISEASRLVDEESHVLRYWEEELALKIPRNDLGHRYYTEVQLDIFRTIKELKRQGYQLKEIRQCLEDMELRRRKTESAKTVGVLDMPGGDEENADKIHIDGLENGPEIIIGDQPVKLPLILPPEEQNGVAEMKPAEIINGQEVDRKVKIQEFRQLMTDIMVEAMDSEFDRISDEITDRVSCRVIKEMNYLHRERDEREEERFKELDAVIRSRQLKGKYRAEVAATAARGRGKRKRWKT